MQLLRSFINYSICFSKGYMAAHYLMFAHFSEILCIATSCQMISCQASPLINKLTSSFGLLNWYVLEQTSRHLTHWDFVPMYGALNHDQHCSQNDLIHDATYSLHEIMEIIWLCRQYDSWKYISLICNENTIFVRKMLMKCHLQNNEYFIYASVSVFNTDTCGTVMLPCTSWWVAHWNHHDDGVHQVHGCCQEKNETLPLLEHSVTMDHGDTMYLKTQTY